MLTLLKEVEALTEGHFLLSSGKHSNAYVQCAKLTRYPDKTEQAAQIIKEAVGDLEFDSICGPAMGGVLIAYEVARAFNKPSFFTERKDNIMCLRRGFHVEPGERVLIVEDVVTTGKSARETAAVLEELGANVVGLACIADRTGGADVGIPLYPGCSLDIDVYDPEDCPLCAAGIPLDQPGSRKQ